VWARVRLVQRLGERAFGGTVVTAATLLAVGVAGYHPYAEDGGIYAAGVKRLLDAGLYTQDAAFVMEPARWSLFAPVVAGLVRLTHLPLEWMLLALHVASVWATLLAARMLAGRCFSQNAARAGSVVLLACWLGLPVAGTALYVMDPYLTARSVATPAMLLAMVGALDVMGGGWEDSARRRRGCAMWVAGLAVCAAMHPLTAMYAAFATVVLACVRARRSMVQVWGVAGVGVTAIAGAACAQVLAPAESAAYVRAALSRSYWFLSEWRWYEVAGLVAPLMILSWVAWLGARRGRGWMVRSHIAESRCGAPELVESRNALARMAVIAGAMACAVAILFAREGAAAHLVARMQPLRMFQSVYVVMIVMLGGWLGERGLRRSAWRWAAAVALLGGVMFGAAQAEYPSTRHAELPWMQPKNAWMQAFDWVRGNTAKDAAFAMDADYIHAAGEDAQSFRAIAERSVLPDFSKDGGEASIAPDLADAWARGVAAQQGLNTISDAERVARLQPLGVTWMVLDAGARTALDCPYANNSVRVCKLP
jgi:hypothetical protein